MTEQLPAGISVKESSMSTRPPQDKRISDSEYIFINIRLSGAESEEPMETMEQYSPDLEATYPQELWVLLLESCCSPKELDADPI